jgi:hypothetical protein
MSTKFVTESLLQVGYKFEQDEQQSMKELNLIKFAKFANWLLKQIDACQPIESCVSCLDQTSTETQQKQFVEELNSALHELSLPLLIEQPDHEKFVTILTHLLSELFSERLLHQDDQDEPMNCDVQPNPAEELRSILNSLNLIQLATEQGLTLNQLLDQINTESTALLESGQLLKEPSALSKVISVMSESQWKALGQLEQQLVHDYELRKRTLITRACCTIDAFRWRRVTGEANKTNQPTDLEQNNRLQQIDRLHQLAKDSLQPTVHVTVADVIAARTSDLELLVSAKVSQSHETCTIEPPANSGIANSGRLQRLSLHKFIIGQVPDRGGRPNEAPAPKKESYGLQQHNRSGGNWRGSAANRNNYSSNRGGNQPNINRIQGAGWNGGADGNRARQMHQNRGDGSGVTGDGQAQDNPGGQRWPGDNRNSKRGRRGAHRGAN